MVPIEVPRIARWHGLCSIGSQNDSFLVLLREWRDISASYPAVHPGRPKGLPPTFAPTPSP